MKIFGKITSNMNLINVLSILDGKFINNSKKTFQILFNEENNLTNIKKELKLLRVFKRFF